MSGGFTPSLRRSDVSLSGKASFLASEQILVKRGGITLDASLVAADENGNKILEEGTFVSEVTATGKYGPYSHADLTDEVQVITIGGAGLESFTLTLDGETTASIDAEATAATIATELADLAGIGAGNVAVAGSVGGPFTVSFIEDLADVDVAAMTATPTGGTGTVTITVETAGGGAISDGRQAPSDDTSGYLLEGVNLKQGDVICGLLISGSVLAARTIPVPDSTIRDAVKGRILFQ